MAPIPFSDYMALTDATCEDRIVAARKQLGDQLVILGHHYQRDEVFRHADYSGDSLKLSRQAAASGARYIVFCGVHFMAEVADILSTDDQVAILPDLAAGCSMADMANRAKVERAWRELASLFDPDEEVTPVTYINSAADLKAFCGEHGGIVCTSSNARKILEWSFARRQRILFFPDQHLGRNTAARMGFKPEEMVLWDFDQPLGGLTEEEIRGARLILWSGFCSVHQLFEPAHIEAFRRDWPQGRVIAHPEASFEVCSLADEVGSTERIIQVIADSPAGTRWLVGTEYNLVNRLNNQFSGEGKVCQFMAPTVCNCSTMYRIDPQHLLWVLENLVAGEVVNRVAVDREEKSMARLALQRMLDASS